MKKKNQITQIETLKEYYIKHPNKEITHPEIVDWATKTWKKRTGYKFRDPDRGIRSLYEKGFLKKIKKGVYRHDPESIVNKDYENFTKADPTMLDILEKDINEINIQ